MKKTLLHLLIWVMSFFAVVGCRIHEFPEDRHQPVPFVLHLDFDAEMPLYKEIVHTRGDEIDTKNPHGEHDLRYLVNVYGSAADGKEERKPVRTFVFTKDELDDLNNSVQIEVPQGEYTFRVWCDYVEEGSDSDKYYNTSDFSEIILADRENHSGSNDFRDAFRGSVKATVSAIKNEATVQMRRPMGKFKFVSTDLEVFVADAVRKMSDKNQAFDKLLQSINFNDYYVVFRYAAFMPCSFNMFTDKPADSWTNMSFRSMMTIGGENLTTMGFDYIFVNGKETTLSIMLEVYDKDGEKISSTNPINVPIVRSKMTVVKGKFLTSMASGGVSINPGYDGDDYNVEIF